MNAKKAQVKEGIEGTVDDETEQQLPPIIFTEPRTVEMMRNGKRRREGAETRKAQLATDQVCRQFAPSTFMITDIHYPSGCRKVPPPYAHTPSMRMPHLPRTAHPGHLSREKRPPKLCRVRSKALRALKRS